MALIDENENFPPNIEILSSRHFNWSLFAHSTQGAQDHDRSDFTMYNSLHPSIYILQVATKLIDIIEEEYKELW